MNLVWTIIVIYILLAIYLLTGCAHAPENLYLPQQPYPRKTIVMPETMRRTPSYWNAYEKENDEWEWIFEE